MSLETQNDDVRIFNAFLSAARTAVASELSALAVRLTPDAFRARVQSEIIDLLMERAGQAPRRSSKLTSPLRNELARRLRDIDLPYDFLGAAHLDYLSNTIDFSGGRVSVARNASRKETGSYYTPRRVVRRIVAETVGRLLERSGGIREAAKLRVADPACGSGVFLLEAAGSLRAFYTANGLPQDEADAIAAAQVIGADISPEAVETAALAFQCAGLPEPRIICSDALRNDRLNWRRVLPEVFSSGGFDAVIGNPPYRAMSRLDSASRAALAAAYEVFAGHGDLHYCFFERALQLLRPGGMMGLLTSSYFMQASHADKLRKLLARESHIRLLVDCTGDDLFPDAGVHCVITVATKGKPGPASRLRLERRGDDPLEFEQGGLSGAPWVIISDGERQWRSRIEKDAVPLGEFCRIVQGPESGLNEAFVVASSYAREAGLEEELLRPLVKNSDIGRYSIVPRDELMIYLPRGAALTRFPKVLAHLERFRESLEAREVCRSGRVQWFELHRPRSPQLMNAARRIICPYRAPENRFAVDGRRCLNDGGDVRMIFTGNDASADLFFLAAVLNSHMMTRYYWHIGRRKGRMLEYFRDSLRLMPVRLAPPDHPLCVTLADLARAQHRGFSEERDYRIERLILDLYELKADPAPPGMLF